MPSEDAGMGEATAPFTGVMGAPLSDAASDSSSVFTGTTDGSFHGVMTVPVSDGASDSSADASEEARSKDASVITDGSIINGLVVNPDAH